MNKKISFSKLLNSLEMPIIVAPMFLVSGIELVVQSCLNGVIGSFPFANCRTIEELEHWLQQITTALQQTKEKNKIAPFAVNVIVHSSYNRLEEELELIKNFQPLIVITSLGSPDRVVDVVHSYGGYVFSDVSNIRYAKKAASENVDGLILVCVGAGGHAGSLSPFSFVDAVKKFWDGKIILAGSINSARSVKASLALGANFVYMGTRFIPTLESMAVDAYKKMIVDSGPEDIINTAAFSGVKGNFMKDSILNAGIKLEDVLEKRKAIDFSNMLKKDTKAWKDIWSAGQGVGAIDKIQSVREVVSALKKEMLS